MCSPHPAPPPHKELDIRGLGSVVLVPTKAGLWGTLKKERNLKCLILTFLILGCVASIIWCRVSRVSKVQIDYHAFPITRTRSGSPCDDGYIYIPSAFVLMLYLLYLIECWHSKTWVQLTFKKTDVKRAYQLIEEMKRAKALVWWKAVCYHYVKRRNDGAPLPRTTTTRARHIHSPTPPYPNSQVYFERINSHIAGGCFYSGYCGMRDISPVIVGLEEAAATKIRLTKTFLFANAATAAEFQEQRSSFFQEQERLDDYMEMKEGLELSPLDPSHGGLTPFRQEILAWASPHSLPWYGRPGFFWLANCFLLSWPLRLVLEMNTATLTYEVTKLFGSNYSTPLRDELLPSPGKYRRGARGGVTNSRPSRSLLPTATATPTPTPPRREEEGRRRRGGQDREPPPPPILLLQEDFEKEGKGTAQENQQQQQQQHFSIHRNPFQLFREAPGARCMKKSVTLLLTHRERCGYSCEVVEPLPTPKEEGRLLVPSYSQAELLLLDTAPSPTHPTITSFGSNRNPIPVGVRIDLTNPTTSTLPPDPHNPDAPPTYEEALRTSTPLFLPHWARIRRCFTEWDVRSSLGGRGGGGGGGGPTNV